MNKLYTFLVFLHGEILSLWTIIYPGFWRRRLLSAYLLSVSEINSVFLGQIKLHSAEKTK